MTRIVLDANIWDKLAHDDVARARIRHLCENGALVVVVPDTLLRQLEASPFAGVPDWFPTEIAPDSVSVLDHSRLDSVRLGSGDIFACHLGESNQVSDAVLVDTADVDADVFISEDVRARKRYARLRDEGRSLDYKTFRAEVLEFEKM